MSDKDKAEPVGGREAASNWYDANDPEKVRPIMKIDWPFIHSLVIEAFQAGAAYQRAKQPSAGVVMPDAENIEEAAAILRNMIDGIGARGNYSQESTLLFLNQALGCLDEFARLNGKE